MSKLVFGLMIITAVNKPEKKALHGVPLVRTAINTTTYQTCS